MLQGEDDEQNDPEVCEDVTPVVPGGLQVILARLQVPVRGARGVRRGCVSAPSVPRPSSHTSPAPRTPYHGVL